ncbi:stimulated by retinoic acid gene 6 protein-like [Dendronephthya gigantea]|uniref:stimulated by retinoic acid gene 6 protein-like n=1 Tax=Dendronephthya gigantea TaxID=151771 RepID=UPI00106ABF5A|nr:stimulated by retinoic acid gene 6 protein-like [Dendronephthya gigantea]
MNSGSTTSVECDVDKTYYPHIFLLPAGIIITILAFLRRRTSFKKDLWGGRPGVVVPVDFLGIDRDRLSTMFVFGAATGSIVILVAKLGIEGRNAWENAFLTVGIAIECAFIYYPYFACLTTHHKIIGALMGLPYAAIFFGVSLTAYYQRCNKATWQVNIGKTLSSIPVILCQLFILGKFIFVLRNEIQECGLFSVVSFSRNETDTSSAPVKLVRPWYRNYVKDLIKRRRPHQYPCAELEFYLRKIYNPQKDFKFSTQILSVVMICCILLYELSVVILFVFGYELGKLMKAPDSENSSYENMNKIMLAACGSSLAGSVLATTVSIISLIRFLENHKNNMLRMFKGDKSFFPSNIFKSQFMLGKGLRYHSFQIGYFLWGYVLLWIISSVICFFLLALSHPFVRGWVLGWISGTGVLLCVAFLLRVFLLIASVTVFRDRDFPRNVISINNRNVFLVFSYFWFFVGLPMGFFSAIFRILKAMAIGALMLPRIDQSIMPDGFQKWDPGFISYICYLHVQAAFRNPVLRVFCQTLIDEKDTQNKNGPKWRRSAQARAKWFIALTLAHNPQLASERKCLKSVAPPQVSYVKNGDVKIEIDQYGPDNAGLILEN